MRPAAAWNAVHGQQLPCRAIEVQSGVAVHGNDRAALRGKDLDSVDCCARKIMGLL